MKQNKVIIAVVSISLLQGLQYCASPVLTQIQAHYPHLSVSLIQMLVTAPGILAIVISFAAGKLVTMISKKKLLLFAALVAAVTAFVPYLSDSFALLFASRMAYGISQGMATALNVAVVSEFFTGEKRTIVMGIQSAGVGISMLFTNVAAGYLGAIDYRHAFLVNAVGIISFILLCLCLPDTGRAVETKTEPIRLNRTVYITTLFGFLEFFFLITFSTNIAMHLSGALAGDSTVSGLITGMFSGVQIVFGLLLGQITKITKRYTLPAAMLAFSLGAVLIILYPDRMVMLLIAAVLCGFSQGVFIPTAFVDVSNAVNDVSATMAAAAVTGGTFLGQITSPVVINAATAALTGSASTGNVFLVACIGMALSAAAMILWKHSTAKYKEVG